MSLVSRSVRFLHGEELYTFWSTGIYPFEDDTRRSEEENHCLIEVNLKLLKKLKKAKRWFIEIDVEIEESWGKERKRKLEKILKKKRWNFLIVILIKELRTRLDLPSKRAKWQKLEKIKIK